MSAVTARLTVQEAHDQYACPDWCTTDHSAAFEIDREPYLHSRTVGSSGQWSVEVSRLGDERPTVAPDIEPGVDLTPEQAAEFASALVKAAAEARTLA